MSNSVDLVNLFSSVTNALEANRAALNTADSHNSDHGDNMVQIFNLVTQAMEEKQSAGQASQLTYASELLKQKDSGSAQLYAQGFEQAAQQFGNKEIDPGMALQLVQTIMGAGQPTPAAAENPLGTLLGGLLGGAASADADDGETLFDTEDLLRGGMAFFKARNEGSTNQEALIEALLAASPFGETPHRAQSSELVASTLLNVLSGMAQS